IAPALTICCTLDEGGGCNDPAAMGRTGEQTRRAKKSTAEARKTLRGGSGNMENQDCAKQGRAARDGRTARPARNFTVPQWRVLRLDVLKHARRFLLAQQQNGG